MSHPVQPVRGEAPDTHTRLVAFVNQACREERLAMLGQKYAPVISLLNTDDEHWLQLGWLMDNARHLGSGHSTLKEEGVALLIRKTVKDSDSLEQGLEFIAFSGRVRHAVPGEEDSVSMLELTVDFLRHVHFRTQEILGVNKSGELCEELGKCGHSEYVVHPDALELLARLQEMRHASSRETETVTDDLPPTPRIPGAESSLRHNGRVHASRPAESLSAQDFSPEDLDKVAPGNRDSLKIISQLAVAMQTTEVLEYLASAGIQNLVHSRIRKHPEQYPGFPYVVAACQVFNIPQSALQEFANHIPQGEASETFGRALLRECERAHQGNGILKMSSIESIVSLARSESLPPDSHGE